MSKMKKVAALLGVEIGEEFQLADNDGIYASVYRITEREVEYFNESINKWTAYDLGINFVSDKRVIKKPWKPNISEVYLYIDETYNVDWAEWKDNFCDFERYAIGNLFSSAEEANKSKEILLEI